MKYSSYFLVFFIFFQRTISAQDTSTIQFGNVTLKDFSLPESAVVDSTTGGVIIADIGSTNFIGNKYRFFSYVFKRYVRIKIMNKNAFDLATLKILLYGKGDRRDRLTDIKAAVYNIGDGKVIVATIDKNDVFEDKWSPVVTENRLAMPSVREGSIIEYSYTITSYRYYDIPSWSFQDLNYPCLYSEYEVVFPNALSYLIMKYGADPFYKDVTTKVKDNRYLMEGLTVISNDMRRHWIMKNIPPFKHEKFIYSPSDFINKLEFTLSQTYNGSDVNDLRSSWENVTNDLLNEPYFGEAIDKNNSVNLANTAEKITSGDKNLMESARNIYFYIRDNFACLRVNSIYLSDNLYDINKKKKGNVADLNLLLIALLRQKGINADPVILSTREHGKNSPEYALLEKMNYVVCMIKAFGDTIYLDASRQDLGFGQLSLDCYNGYARVISRDGGPVYLSAARIREQETTFVFIINEGPGKLGGSCESVSSGFKAEVLRKEIGTSSTRKYFDDIRSAYPGEIEMMKAEIDSLKKPGVPAKTHFEFTMPAVDDILYFNPVIMTEYKQNPFKSEERKYPVSLPFPIDNLYTLNMEVPEGYIVDELPKSATVFFNDNQGFFEYSIQANKNNLQFRSRISLNEIFYLPADYQQLREFFSFIVRKYSEQIVFKKKS